MKFVMHKDKVISTRQGLSYRFLKGVPTHVAPECFDEVIAAGGTPESEIEEAKPKNVNEPSDPADRKTKIMQAFVVVKKENARNAFTAIGVPKPETMFEKIGFKVEGKELHMLWTEFLQADPNDLPVVEVAKKGK